VETLSRANRRHFFHAVAQARRRILIEHARKQGRVEPGGYFTHVSLYALEFSVGENSDFFWSSTTQYGA